MASLEGRALGRYTIEQLVGKGGMADVYLAYDPQSRSDVAVKVFKREDEEMLRRFIREARLMSSLHNKHLMPIYDTGSARVDGVTQYFIVMPYMAGGSLRSLTRHASLPLKQVCHYLVEIAEALDYIHTQGVIHRDIKSSNVLLDNAGNCYLSDFGIARTASDATQLTSTGNVLGTVDYVAPELFETDRKADARSDLYSLGVLLFEMVTGHLPFSAENQIALVAMHINNAPPSPRKYVPQLSPQVERVFLRALEKKPERRYATGKELADAFCQAVQGRATTQATTPYIPSSGDQIERQQQLVLPAASPVPVALRPAPLVGVPSTRQQLRSEVPTSIPNSPLPATRRTAPETKRMQVVAIIALLALLAVLVPIIYVAAVQPWRGTSPSRPTQATNNPTAGITSTVGLSPTPNLTATAQAVTGTATATSAHATATAIVAPTATFQAQATATAGVILTATAGNPLYANSLTDANNVQGWDQNSHCVVKNDGYHVKEAPSLLGIRGCRLANKQFSAATYVVDVTIASGQTGGLFFDVTTDPLGSYAGYLFQIDSEGKYRVLRSNNFTTGSGEKVLQDWTASSALHPNDNAKNKIAVIAKDGNFSFYANNVFLTTVQDTKFTSGNVAFLATTKFSGPDADVIYDSIQIFAQG